MLRIFSLTGCGGVGKDTILNKLIKSNKSLKSIISTTSRPMRNNEKNGVEYNFATYEKAHDIFVNDEFIEKRIYDVIDDKGDKVQWIYGITKESINLNSNNTYIAIIDFNGLLQLEEYLKQNNKENSLISIYIDVNKQNRLLRYMQRENMNDNKVDEAIRRFLDDDKNVLPAKDYCKYVVNNDGDIENTINKILDIIEESED